MRGPVLPAAGFGFGLLAGQALGLDGASSSLSIAAGLALVVGTRRDPSAGRSARLLSASRIAPRPARPSRRDRILSAAGFGVQPRPAPARSGLAVLLIGAVLAGAGWFGVRSRPPLLPRGDGPFAAQATSDVERSAWGWGVELLISSRTDGRTVELHAWASDEGSPPTVVAGDRLVVRGWLEPLGDEGFDAFLRSRGLDAALHPTSVRVVGPSADPLLRMANSARSGLRRGAVASLHGREAGLFLGLAIGDTEGMDGEVEEDFRASGLGHLLAVSGSNVAMFLAPVMAGAAAMGLRLRGRVVVGVGAVVVFAMITRWEPSVLRAGAMAGLALAAAWGGRPRSTSHVLSAAVLLLLVADPALVTSLGFQLSVAATAGLAAMAGPLAARLSRLPRWLALTLAATLAAQAAVTPLLLLHFGVVPTVTVLANVLASLAVAPALVLGVAASAAGVVWAPAGRAMGFLAEVPIRYLIEVADRTARFTLPTITSEGLLIPVLAALAVVALARFAGRGRAIRVVALVGVVGAVAWVVAPAAGPPVHPEVVFLDVGQGDAAVIRAPDGATVLIDAGPDELQVATELARLAVRRVDLAVASHAHADHIEGFPAVFSRFPVSTLVEPGCPADSPSYDDLLEAAADEGIPVRHPRGGARYLVGTIRIDVLGPEECTGEPNDDSLVLRVRLGGAAVLFAGDAEVAAQRDLIADGDPIGAEVLKVPHHGGDTSDPAFLRATGARIGVVSTGPNDYGHPHPRVLAVLRGARMLVYRTDLAGDVTITFPGGGAVDVRSG
jgi:competence protein ComEC